MSLDLHLDSGSPVILNDFLKSIKGPESEFPTWFLETWLTWKESGHCSLLGFWFFSTGMNTTPISPPLYKLSWLMGWGRWRGHGDFTFFISTLKLLWQMLWVVMLGIVNILGYSLSLLEFCVVMQGKVRRSRGGEHWLHWENPPYVPDTVLTLPTHLLHCPRWEPKGNEGGLG